VHRLSWVESGEIDALSRDFFIHALLDMGACYLLYDESDKCICITRLPDPWTRTLVETPTDLTLFGPEIADRLSALKKGLTNPGMQDRIDVSPDEETVFEFRCRKVDIPERGLYFITSITDKSEERQREKLLRTLLLEVSHRSKNLLAVVQGIASQTARFSGSLDSFLQKFRGRLYALSQSQDLVTESSWKGATFLDLLRGQLSRYVADASTAIEVEAENILLSPNAAMHVGLALHELIINAISHGDILKGTGTVRVSCHRIQTAAGSEIKIVWTEQPSSGTFEEAKSIEGQFGSTVLQKVVPASVNGRAIHRVDESGIHYELTFPADVRD
jgi:two-component sensor histidine kinase